MNKSELASSVSIEFGLSIEQSKKTIDSIFGSIYLSLEKNKNIKINKFGKFKLISPKDDVEKNISIKFTPSGKLSQRVNGNFDNLKKVTIKSELPLKDKIIVTKDKKIKTADDKNNETINVSGAEDMIPQTRKLISEDVIKLHKEITEVKDDDPSKPNLWR